MDGGPYLLSVTETDTSPKNTMRQRQDNPCRHPGTVSDAGLRTKAPPSEAPHTPIRVHSPATHPPPPSLLPQFLGVLNFIALGVLTVVFVSHTVFHPEQPDPSNENELQNVEQYVVSLEARIVALEQAQQPQQQQPQQQPAQQPQPQQKAQAGFAPNEEDAFSILQTKQAPAAEIAAPSPSPPDMPTQIKALQQQVGGLKTGVSNLNDYTHLDSNVCVTNGDCSMHGNCLDCGTCR